MVDGCVDSGAVVITEQSLLVETITRQQTMLHDLERRLGETEYFLDGCESDIHQRRREENGENYLQDVYLFGGVGLSADADVADGSANGHQFKVSNGRTTSIHTVYYTALAYAFIRIQFSILPTENKE